MPFVSEGSISRNTGRISSPVTEHTRPQQDDEPARKGKNRMYYCKYYVESWDAQNITNFWKHLKSKHGITTTSQLK
ncbi:hypothetical protein B0H67DRAFT_239704 [Lasiosphaeris hirsuta]|uniref:Uncharacterized protein n=1 Tax=Lasiosphaeris hirsuta TaxID=260670 RepID=A0AA40AGH2_9PEZI|nr:hypothetical protein B0H67DRAFT_239704 [Lasiosphaeris hirsuta]